MRELIKLIIIAFIAAIAIMFVYSCGTPRKFNEPIGPYHIGDPLTVCDHFYVKQSHTASDSAQFDMDWQPCICLKCNELNICK